jgi:hypothetical protein
MLGGYNMPTTKVQTGQRFDEDLLRKITYIAKKESRSLNNQVEYAVKRLVADYEKEHGPIPLDSD